MFLWPCASSALARFRRLSLMMSTGVLPVSAFTFLYNCTRLSPISLASVSTLKSLLPICSCTS